MATRKKTLKEDRISKANRVEVFCLEYLIDFNATRAAVASGYSKKTAQMQGSRLLSNVMVQAKLEELKKALLEKKELRIEDILEELKNVGRSNIQDYVKKGDEKFVIFKNVDDLPPEIAGAIESIKFSEKGVELKLHSKLKALELAGRYHGMFTDNLNVKGSMTGYLTIDKLLDAAEKKKKKNGIKSKRPKRK